MKFNKEFKIGLLGLVSIAILYFGINFLKGTDFLSPTHSYYVNYPMVNGLSQSNQILIDGFNVGIVGDMEINQTNGTKIMVELKIKKKVKVGKNAQAILIDTDLLGGKAIKINPGNLTELALPGDTLRGSVQKSLTEEFTDRAMPVVQSFDTTMMGVNDFFVNYSEQAATLGEVLVSIRDAARRINYIMYKNQQKWDSTFTNLEEITENLSHSSYELKGLVESTANIMDSVEEANLGATIKSMNENLENLQVVTKKLADGEGSLGKLIHDDQLYENLNNSVVALDTLLDDLNRNPKRYVHFSVFGKKDKKK